MKSNNAKKEGWISAILASTTLGALMTFCLASIILFYSRWIDGPIEFGDRFVWALFPSGVIGACTAVYMLWLFRTGAITVRGIWSAIGRFWDAFGKEPG